MCTRGPAGWSVPTRLGPPVDTTAPEFFPSVTRGGVLYFTRRDEQTGHEAIWRAQPLPDGSFAQPTQLDSTVNSGRTQFNAFVAPDESYVIVCVMGRADNLGQIDYFISFHDSDGSWHGPVNLGDQINGTGKEGWSPYVSPDGRAFFFMSSRRAPEPAALAPLTRAKLNALHDSPGNGNGQIWWMDAGFLSRLREKAG
jgi:hypothetical protein